jgi:hypothetical protein
MGEPSTVMKLSDAWKLDRLIGSREERARIRAKVEEMRKFHFDRQPTSNTISYPWAALDELLRWLDEEASHG